MKSVLIISGASKPLLNFRIDIIKQFIAKGYQVYTISPDPIDFVQEALTSLGVKMVYIPVNRTSINFLDDLVYLWRIRKVVKEIRPDLVYAFTVKPVTFGVLGARLGGCKNIYPLISGLGVIAGRDLSPRLRLIRAGIYALYRLAFRFSSRVIFQNEEDMEQLIGAKVLQPEKAFRVMGSGINLEHFPVVSPSINPVRFIFIGRFIEQKGVRDFVRAAEIVQKSGYGSNAKFTLLGQTDTTPGAISENEIQELGRQGIVEYVAKQKDVRPYLQQASVFVLPSYYGEGVPRTALEALSTGLPVIMSDSRGCRDVVIDGTNGFMVPIKNPEALSEKMIYLIKNPELISKMGRSSRAYAEKVFDVKKVNQKSFEIMGLAQ